MFFEWFLKFSFLVLGLKETGFPQLLDREKLFKVFRKKETGSPMLDRENFSKFSKGFQKERKSYPDLHLTLLSSFSNASSFFSKASK